MFNNFYFVINYHFHKEMCFSNFENLINNFFMIFKVKLNFINFNDSLFKLIIINFQNNIFMIFARVPTSRVSEGVAEGVKIVGLANHPVDVGTEGVFLRNSTADGKIV